MARTLEVKAVTGIALTIEVIARGTDIITETIVMTEKATAKQIYAGTIAVAPAGQYDLNLKVGASYIGDDAVVIDGDDPSVSYAESVGLTITVDVPTPVVTVVVSAAAVAMNAIMVDNTITIHRGDHVSFQITGLGSLAGRDGEKLYFTMKTKPDNDLQDLAAVLQITELTGAIRIAGSAAGALAGDASIVVDDEDLGDITITIEASITELLTPHGSLYYDIQVSRPAAEPETILQGRGRISVDVTRRR